MNGLPPHNKAPEAVYCAPYGVKRSGFSTAMLHIHHDWYKATEYLEYLERSKSPFWRKFSG